MGKSRLEAFSDGVIAVIITIIVLEVKPPAGVGVESLSEIAPHFFSYLLSFVYIAIYWNNHHHMLHTVQRVNGQILWANMHLLFWLSLVPWSTAWMAEHHFATIPVAMYGFLLLMSAIAYTLLEYAVICLHGRQSLLALAVGTDRKGKTSIVLYVVGLIAAFWSVWISIFLYALVACIWLIPDRRIERVVEHPS